MGTRRDLGDGRVLLVLGILLIAAPDAIPGLTVPGDGGTMGGGDRMMDNGGGMQMH